MLIADEVQCWAIGWAICVHAPVHPGVVIVRQGFAARHTRCLHGRRDLYSIVWLSASSQCLA